MNRCYEDFFQKCIAVSLITGGEGSVSSDLKKPHEGNLFFTAELCNNGVYSLQTLLEPS